MTLTGTWKGKYIYGEGYAAEIIGRSGPFEFDIRDEDSIFTGTCVDDVVKKTKGNESFIEGIFKDGYISFLKTYKYHTTVDTPADNEPFELLKTEGVQYTGELHKTFFTGKSLF